MLQLPTTPPRRRHLRLRSQLRWLAASRLRVLGLAGACVSVLVLLEWRLDFDFSLGILYVLPVMIASTVLPRWQIILTAIFCAYTRGLFTADETHLEHLLRFCMATIAYTGCGLLIYQIVDSRRTVLSHYARIRFEQKLRRSAEEQLRLLAQSSPAAILTISGNGEVLAANDSAQQLFAEGETLLGHSVRSLVPLFADALSLPDEISGVRTQASTWAQRRDGTRFPATAWFSIYGSGEAKRLAAILVDVSTEVREREHAHFEDLVQQNRVLAGAVSHEIRNLCASISVVQRNLAASTSLKGNEDFDALTRLIQGLSDISTFDLRNQSRASLAAVQLHRMVEQLRVVIDQDWKEIDGRFESRIPLDFPLVQAERQGLLQVLLNLAQNSLRAVEDAEERLLVIEASHDSSYARLRVMDTGPGVAHPEQLFQAFQTGARERGGSGLGLYVSRAIAKSFGATLEHTPTTSGCCFTLTLRLAVLTETEASATEVSLG